MQRKIGGILKLVVFVVAAGMLAVPAWAGGEVYVVGASRNGDADYMGSYGDGGFSSLEVMQVTQDSGITAYPVAFGNGLGDFDNDGEYDYIAAFGYGAILGLPDVSGFIYISKKLGAGDQFAPPVNVATWTEGYYAMDMAVADFNGDGNQDFVMSYMGSPNTGLYLGDGEFGFTYSVLENTAPAYSAGIDATDFNNDGIADFVVAPNSADQIYVNLGNPDGTFTKQTFSTHDGNAVYGIAAADFINNDGIADIATASYDYLIIYAGNGDGTFEWSASYEFDLNQSPIDNYDFDGDGNQDLVAASFGEALDGVAVLLNNGDGTFRLDNIYPGTNTDPNVYRYLNAVTAPPYVPKANVEPLAVLDADSYEATVGEAIEFDGGQSDDEDGEIVSYVWDFGDNTPGTEGGAAKETHVFNEADTYDVTLTVIDDKGATATAQAEVHVAAAPVAVSVKVAFTPHTLFAPRKLNLNSQGKWITATIWVPAGYDARQIDMDSVQIAMDSGTTISACTNNKYGFFKNLFKRYRSRHMISVKFDRKLVSEALAGASGRTLLTVVGKMNSNGKSVDFSGEGTIQVIGKHKKTAHHGHK